MGDEKNLHPVGHKFVFNCLSGDILFSSLLSYAFFVFSFYLPVCLLFEIKNIYSDTHSLRGQVSGNKSSWATANKTTFFFVVWPY